MTMKLTPYNRHVTIGGIVGFQLFNGGTTIGDGPQSFNSSFWNDSWKNVKKRRNALSKCRLVKLKKKLVYTVWVSFKAVITEKTLQEEWTNKNYFYDNYNSSI